MSQNSYPRSHRLIDDEKKLCPECGYNVTGHLAAGISRCPECGKVFSKIELVDADRNTDEVSSCGQPQLPPRVWWMDPALVLWGFAPTLLMGLAFVLVGPLNQPTLGRGLALVAVLAAPFSLYAWARFEVRAPPDQLWDEEAARKAAGMCLTNLVATIVLRAVLAMVF